MIRGNVSSEPVVIGDEKAVVLHVHDSDNQPVFQVVLSVTESWSVAISTLKALELNGDIRAKEVLDQMYRD